MASTETTEGNETPAERPLIMRYAARSDVGRIRSKMTTPPTWGVILPWLPMAWAVTREATSPLRLRCWT